MHCSTEMTLSSTTWQKPEILWKFLSLTLLTKGRNKTFKCLLLLISTWRVECFAWVKKDAELKENKVNPKKGWYIWRICRWSWIFQHFLLDIKMFTCIHRLFPFDLDPWKFIIVFRYNPNPMLLISFTFFSFHSFLNRVKEH